VVSGSVLMCSECKEKNYLWKINVKICRKGEKGKGGEIALSVIIRVFKNFSAFSGFV
jgi:hypothetical protein